MMNTNNKGQRKSWLANVMALWVMQMASYILPFIALPYMVRTLSIEGFGRLVFAASAMQFVVLFIDSGFNSVSQRTVAISNGGVQAVSNALMTSVCARSLVALFTMALMAGLVAAMPTWQHDIDLLLVSGLLVIGTLAFPQWLFVALQNTRPMVFCHVAGRTISVVLIFVFVRNTEDLLIAAALQSSATLLAGLLALGWLLQTGQIRIGKTNWNATKGLIRSGVAIGLPTFMVAAAANATVFLLGVFSTPAIVGVYSAIEKLIRAAGGLFNAVVQAAYPIVCRGYGQPEFERLALRFTAAATTVAIVGAIGTYFLSEHLLVLAFGTEFARHSGLLSVMALAMVGTCLTLCGGHLILLARRQDTRFSAVQTILAAIAWFAFLLVAQSGDPGHMALTVTLMELLSALLMWFAVYWPTSPQREVTS